MKILRLVAEVEFLGRSNISGLPALEQGDFRLREIH